MDYKEKYYKYKTKYLSLKNNLNMIKYESKLDNNSRNNDVNTKVIAAKVIIT